MMFNDVFTGIGYFEAERGKLPLPQEDGICIVQPPLRGARQVAETTDNCTIGCG